MEEQNELQIISSTDALGAVAGAEIDKSIATAKMYPRDINQCLADMNTMALIDTETAQGCYYHLERKDAYGNKTIIEGPSIRLAEICAEAWGNIRVATRVIGNDGSMVTVEAVAMDLQKNVSVLTQQVRSIKTKQGKTYSNDMQTVTINAASAIAMRNAICKVVPKVFIDRIANQCKEMVKGNADNLEQRRQKMISAFAGIGVTLEMILQKLEVATMSDITIDMVANMVGVFNSLKDGNTTKEEEFAVVVPAEKQQKAAEKINALLNAQPKEDKE